MLRTALLTSAFILASAPSTAFAEDAALEITNFIGTVKITNAPGKITVNGENKGTAKRKGDRLIIDGGETIKSVNCKNTNGNIKLKLGSWGWSKRIGGYKNLEDYPTLSITVPNDTHVEFSKNVIFGSLENIGSADIKVSHCGSLEIGNITNKAALYVSGSGDITTENIGTGEIKISGSGDVTIGSSGKTNVSISGSGDFGADDINDSLKIAVSGSGDAEVENIRGDLTYISSGSPNFHAENVGGDIDITMSGSSDIDINDSSAENVSIKSSGSSDIFIGGEVGNINVKASGSSDIDIEEATGDRDVKVSSATDVTIGGTHYGK